MAAKRNNDGITIVATLTRGERRNMDRSNHKSVLRLRDLCVEFAFRGRRLPALKDVSLDVPADSVYGLVGESGCGKSTLALAAMRHLAPNGQVTSGSIEVDGVDALALHGEALRHYYRDVVGMIFQDPGAALNPTLRVGGQIGEVLDLKGIPRTLTQDRITETLLAVHIGEAEAVKMRYPHELSGGMQQRVLIAMALAAEPRLLFLDEPTTGLDATVEAEVLNLIGEMQERLAATLIFVSHNLELIRRFCARCAVLYAGRVVEKGLVDHVFRNPRHPYTVGLLRSIPRAMKKSEGRLPTIPGGVAPLWQEAHGCSFAERCPIAQELCWATEPLLLTVSGSQSSRCHFWNKVSQEAIEWPSDSRANHISSISESYSGFTDEEVILHGRNLSKTYRGREDIPVIALRDAEITLRRGETLGLVGESGSGKSTLANILLGLTRPDSGAQLEFEGRPLATDIRKRHWEETAGLQLVFQNPSRALNERIPVKRIISRAVKRMERLPAARREERVLDLLSKVRFDAAFSEHRPPNLSGGLKQRIAIARALAGSPKLVVCDEPTSSLDVSVQASILNLLVDLQQEQEIAYLFISHDLNVVRYIADRLMVLYTGEVLEVGATDQAYSPPHHPYTELLLSSAVWAKGRPTCLADQNDGVSNPSETLRTAARLRDLMQRGCVFRDRCRVRLGEMCDDVRPSLREVEPGHWIRCHHSLDSLCREQRGSTLNRNHHSG